MSRTSECGNEENVVRAICDAHYDRHTQKISSSLFNYKNGVSVSRLAILPLGKIEDIFISELATPAKPLHLMGEINVGELKKIGAEFAKEQEGKSPPVELSVVPDPTPTNPSHALIPGKISRGLAKRIVARLIRHEPSRQY